MEEDREATNLGPETPAEVPEAPEAPIEAKQPKRRFIGRRAALEKAANAANGTSSEQQQQQTIEGGGALTAPRPRRGARTLHQVPDEILHNTDINEAIAHLPANYNFEIHKTIHRVRSSGAKMVALQFPEGLLLFAPVISDILTRFCAGTETVIMGDVTYGACCIDDYTARALGCDLLVHYGHSCLVPVDTTKGIRTLYVFVTIGIDVEHLIATVERNFGGGTKKKIALVGTIQFNATLHQMVPRLRAIGLDAVLPRSAPLSAGEILGCTAPTLTATINKEQEAEKGAEATDADMILYVGDGRFHLESIMIASPQLRERTYRYDPYSRRLTHESYEHKDMHSLRRLAIQGARRTLVVQPEHVPGGSSSTSAADAAAAAVDVDDDDDRSSLQTAVPKTWALVLGTLGRQGNSNTLDLITGHLDRMGMPWVTLLLSEVFPQKLALMSRDIGVWVQVACPRLSIDWGYAFERPLLSPYEALVALGARQGEWEGSEEQQVYPMDYYEKNGLGRTNEVDVVAAKAAAAATAATVTAKIPIQAG